MRKKEIFERIRFECYEKETFKECVFSGEIDYSLFRDCRFIDCDFLSTYLNMSVFLEVSFENCLLHRAGSISSKFLYCSFKGGSLPWNCHQFVFSVLDQHLGLEYQSFLGWIAGGADSSDCWRDYLDFLEENPDLMEKVINILDSKDDGFLPNYYYYIWRKDRHV